MTEETLERANELSGKLKEFKDALKKIKYTQSENVKPRESVFKCNGIEGHVIIPGSLFRTIGKLIEAEYVQMIDVIQKELDEL